MNRAGKSLQATGKHLSNRVKQKLHEKKKLTHHGVAIRMVQPHIPIEEQSLTKAMRKEIKNEFEKNT